MTSTTAAEYTKVLDALLRPLREAAQRIAARNEIAYILAREDDECGKIDDLARCNAMLAEAAANASAKPATLAELMARAADHDAADALDDIEPTDYEIMDVVATTFGMTHAQAIERLLCVDLVALRGMTEVAA